MADSIPYFIVDVFAEERYAGNQLAVFIDLENRLNGIQMLAITREINFAESAFIRSRESDNTFAVRIFTPEYEVPFAGHPSLGSAYICAKHLMTVVKGEIVLRLKEGAINIQIGTPQNLETSRFTMQQAQPCFGTTFTANEITLGLHLPLDAVDSSMPIQEISTGLPYIIIFVKDLKTIQQLQLSEQTVLEFLIGNKMYKNISASALTTSLFFVTSETLVADSDYHARMFALENGKIVEDAATGSANGCLLAYLLKYSGKLQFARVEQGFEMGRNSVLYLDGAFEKNEYRINIGGQVVPISEGTWFVS